jgi:hypothetical protein
MAIIQWREFVPDCTATCKEQFIFMLQEDYGIVGLDYEDLLSRCCQRYVGYLKLIHHKVKRYFTEEWAINGVSEQFSKKEAKWLLPIIQRRISKDTEAKLDLESMEKILLWVGLRYNFWLADQL